LDDPADDELPIAPDSGRIEASDDPGPRLDLEKGLDLGLLGAGSQDLGTDAAPENEREGMYEDRLPRPRLARDHAKSRGKLENELLDEHDVLDT
jgi:hypothetical protein